MESRDIYIYVTRFAKTRLIAGELNSGYRRLCEVCSTPVEGPIATRLDCNYSKHENVNG